jgi:23S rRNA (guanosine2251-2'-O)-methyltransferase
MSPPDPRSVAAVLENIRSMGNVGSIFRSADGAGVDRLLISGYTAHPPRTEISKTALGAEEHVAWEYWSRAVEAVAALRQQGYRVIGLEKTSESIELESLLRADPLDGPVAFVVGHEIEGVSDAVLARCDQVAHLPMLGQKDSLNVAVAFGLAAYTLRRCRGQA